MVPRVYFFAQSAGAVEYTEGQDSHKGYPVYNTKQSDGEVPVMLGLWGMRSTPSIAIAPRSTLAQRGSTWYGPIYGLNRNNGIFALNGIVRLNWVAWNRNVFDN